jgi:hypothetical protein
MVTISFVIQTLCFYIVVPDINRVSAFVKQMNPCCAPGIDRIDKQKPLLRVFH